MDDGTLILLGDETLTVYVRSRGERIAHPVASVTKLEIHRGRKGSARAAAKDAGIGALLGAGLGALAGAGSAALAHAILPWGDAHVGRAAAEAAVEGAATGAVAGAVYGATAGEGVWEVVTVHQLREELCHCQVPVAAAQAN